MGSVCRLSRTDQIFDRSLKAFAKFSWQDSPRLGYVDFKCGIKRRIEINGSPRQLHVLVERTHAAPSTTLNHAVSPVDIETLLRVPFPRAGLSMKCVFARETFTRRQNEWLESCQANAL